MNLPGEQHVLSSAAPTRVFCAVLRSVFQDSQRLTSCTSFLFCFLQMLSPPCSGSVAVGNAQGPCSQPADAAQAAEMDQKYPKTSAPKDQKLF